MPFDFDRGGVRFDDRQLLAHRRIFHPQHEHEAVELRLGQRIGSFLLDRILRGQHEERRGQIVGLAAAGHLPLLHRLKQGRLRFRRRAVDFVGQQDVGEDRAADEAKVAPAALLMLIDDFGAGDVGRHQVGRELNAIELQVDRPRDGLDHQRFGQAGDADHQAMAAGKDRREQIVQHFGLADDDAADLVAQSPAGPDPNARRRPDRAMGPGRAQPCVRNDWRTGDGEGTTDGTLGRGRRRGGGDEWRCAAAGAASWRSRQRPFWQAAASRQDCRREGDREVASQGSFEKLGGGVRERANVRIGCARRGVCRSTGGRASRSVPRAVGQAFNVAARSSRHSATFVVPSRRRKRWHRHREFP